MAILTPAGAGVAEGVAVGVGVGVGVALGFAVGAAGAVVGIALEVRNVITAENDTNLVRRITANLTMCLRS